MIKLITFAVHNLVGSIIILDYVGLNLCGLSNRLATIKF